jgi:catechol 2,3-dioxygenase-like lactoylglutathione lyase family enzyme
MAYRFLLEVGGALAAEASVAVEQAGDAQVLVVRDSHGLGFEDPYVDLTVAAHTLRVIDSLYDWFDGMGASRGDVRIVLHGGERLSLEGLDRGAMVAAIRRDQPWVERSIPKVGEHEPPETGGVARYDEGERRLEQEAAIDATGANAPAAGAALDRSWVAPGAMPEMTREVQLRGLNHISVQVNDLAKAERFYGEFLNMEMLGRARRGDRGAYVPINGDYRWDAALAAGEGADVAFMGNGPVRLALHRAGRGARIERGVIDHLSVAVDARTFATVRAQALVRPLTILGSTDTSFTFRDPFNVVWELVIDASIPTPRGGVELAEAGTPGGVGIRTRAGGAAD